MSAALLGLVAAGCSPPQGTGKLGVLYIGASSNIDTAAGLTTTVHVYTHRLDQDPMDDGPRDEWDLKGTTLEAEGPPGLTFKATYNRPAPWLDREMYEGHVLEIGCGAEPNVTHEVRIRVKAEGKVRYEDAFDITCWEPTGLTLQPVSYGNLPPVTSLEGRYLVGGRFEARPQLSGTVRGQPDVPLLGKGLVLEDRGGLLRQPKAAEGPYAVEFEVIAAGHEPLLAYRNATFTLTNVETVESTSWTPAIAPLLGTSSLDGVVREWALTAYARAPDGGELRGLQGCSWVVHTKDASEPRQMLGSCQFILSQEPTRACVTVAGQETCQSFP